MFGKDTESQEMDSRQTSVLAQGCKFDGKIDVHGTLRIEGDFKGEIQTPENLVIGKTGVVHAAVKVKNAVIGGQLYGNITAENKIELQSGSHVEGDIKTKRLVIDEGVFFEGNCSMRGGDASPRSDAGSGAKAATTASTPPASQPTPQPAASPKK